MKKEISEFLKIAYRNNKVKELEEAFNQYLADERWSNEKVENIIREKQESYGITDYKIGDIVFVKEYCYSNEKTGNNHLFVIIDQNNTAVPIENFGMLISSNLEKLKFISNKLLQKDEINHLHKDSLVKTDVVYRILNEQIKFKIGKADCDNIEQYKKSFLARIENKRYSLKNKII